jgi:hypothetical protein
VPVRPRKALAGPSSLVRGTAGCLLGLEATACHAVTAGDQVVNPYFIAAELRRRAHIGIPMLGGSTGLRNRISAIRQSEQNPRRPK